MLSEDAQTNRRENIKQSWGPTSHARSAWPAGRKVIYHKDVPGPHFYALNSGLSYLWF